MLFYCGVHYPALAQSVPRAFLSVNVLRSKHRQSAFSVQDWIMDSGAFTELVKYGGYRYPVAEYADWIRRFARCGNLQAAVSQDYMCEPFVLARTGLSVTEHQQRTVARYDELMQNRLPVLIMPVLQGYFPEDYLSHIREYGDRLRIAQWVGVGSVCKRNGDPRQIVQVLSAIKQQRPDLRLHGFGLKTTALQNPYVRSLLYSADSMAWSYAARRQGRDANSRAEAVRFFQRIQGLSGGQHQFQLPGVWPGEG